VFISPSVFIMEIYNVYSEVENMFVENWGEILLPSFHKKLNNCAEFFIYSETVCAFTYPCGMLSLVSMYCHLCGRYRNKIFRSFQTWKEVMLLSTRKRSPGCTRSPYSFKERRAKKSIRLMCYLNSKINISWDKSLLQRFQLVDRDRKESFEVGVPGWQKDSWYVGNVRY